MDATTPVQIKFYKKVNGSSLSSAQGSFQVSLVRGIAGPSTPAVLGQGG